jgi:hypothetical protein
VADNQSQSGTSNLLSLIFIVIGLLLMVGSAGFLVYSRKILLPKQKAATQAMLRQQNALQQQGGAARQPFRQLSSAQQGGMGMSKPMMKPSASVSSGSPIARNPLGQRVAARKALLKGFGDNKENKDSGIKPSVSSDATRPKLGAGLKGEESKGKDDFVSLSPSGAKSQPDKAKQDDATFKTQPSKSSAIFEKLKALSQSYKGKPENPEDAGGGKTSEKTSADKNTGKTNDKIGNKSDSDKSGSGSGNKSDSDAKTDVKKK